ncbi:Protein of unknown function [Cotesia congregata]|uniref:Uncharacterized protein n=1 Tax=Cotesia congregata TaxID=51543 RepID=A0A8J2MQR0_COTCN|nr:Protein of unknown function [Cotesia congregata]
MTWNWRKDFFPSGDDYSVINFVKRLFSVSGNFNLNLNCTCNSVLISSGDSEDGDGDVGGGGGGGGGRADTFIITPRFYLPNGFLTSQLYGFELFGLRLVSSEKIKYTVNN